MKITYNKNPLFTTVELDENEKKELWYKIKIKEMEELLFSAHFYLEEKYFDLRAVWGQKIDISTSTNIEINYHKECSLAKSKDNITSIGATHHRFEKNQIKGSYDLKLKNINNLNHDDYTKTIMQNDIDELLKKANDIKKLENIKIIDIKIGARASSIDYFPMVGKLIDSKKSFEKYPHLKNGFQIKNENLEMIENFYVLNGVGGR